MKTLYFDPSDPVYVAPEKTTGLCDKTLHSRWTENIEDLYKILKIDEASHLTEGQRDRVKSLIAEFRDIFSEGEDDVGCTDIAEQDIILDTDVHIRER